VAGFELLKWYADCVSDDGDFAILYHAELEVARIPIRYESLLLNDGDGSTRALYSLHQRQAPLIEDGRIGWDSPQWQARGVWTELGAPICKALFESESGFLEWTCVAPRAVASLEVGENSVLKGWGYVEHLRLTVAPWRLPIRRLRWGRFVNATDALVWIDWSGAHNTQLVCLNDLVVTAEEINDDEVVLSEQQGILHLDGKRLIREGKLGATALSIIPRLNTLFPSSVLNMRECKWLSRAVLRRPGQPDSVGMAIHEVVEWP
jgi:hypothetical protein